MLNSQAIKRINKQDCIYDMRENIASLRYSLSSLGIEILYDLIYDFEHKDMSFKSFFNYSYIKLLELMDDGIMSIKDMNIILSYIKLYDEEDM